MRFAVDTWDPSYGPNVGFEADDASVSVDVGVECAPGAWRALAPQTGRSAVAAFVDGVRRVEARVWLGGADEQLELVGQCASWAAGAVVCRAGQVAAVDHVIVGRSLVAPPPGANGPIVTHHATYRPVLAASAEPPAMWLAVQDEMARGEHEVGIRVRRSHPDALLILDGPLRGRDHLERCVGYVKSHQVAYLPTDLRHVADSLQPGERTPLFLVGGPHPRLSWYVRLAAPSAPTPLAGCARCEIAANTTVQAAVELADQVTATLWPLASDPVRERRAPQNLYPIAGLERELRHRLGDEALLVRALRVAAQVPQRAMVSSPSR